MTERKQNRRERRRRILIWILIAGMILPTIATVVSVSMRAVSQSDIDRARQQVQSLQQKITAAKSELKTLQSDQNSLIAQKKLIDDQINLYNEQIDLLEETLADLDTEIEACVSELTELQTSLDEKYDTFKERVRIMYEDGTTSYLSVLLSADSMEDFLNRAELVSAIFNRDQKLMTEMNDLIAAKEQKQTELAQNRTESLALQGELKAARQELLAEQAEAEVLLAGFEDGTVQNLALIEEYEALLQQAAEEEERLTKEYEEQKRKEAEAKKKAEEAAKKKAEEEAKKKAEEEKKKQQQSTSVAFDWPTPGYTWITCPFGPRTHPVTGKYSNHNGVDIGAYAGSPIRSTAAGTVITNTYNSVYGNMIKVDHGNGIVSMYAHMNARSKLKVGATVQQGTVLGYVGTTGLSSGYHLHFTIFKDGVAVNPLNYVKPR